MAAGLVQESLAGLVIRLTPQLEADGLIGGQKGRLALAIPQVEDNCPQVGRIGFAFAAAS